MNEVFDLYKPVDLEPNRSNELCQIMRSATPILQAAAERNGLENLRKLRRMFWANETLDLTPVEIQTLINLKDLEPEVLSGWIKMTGCLCNAFHYSENRIGVSIDDYVQESAMALVDCMYGYNQGEFSTYVYNAVKNRLIDFIRRESASSGVSRDMIAMRMNVRLTMMKNGVGFDAAIDMLRDCSSISETQVMDLRQSMRFTVRESTLLGNHEGDNSDDYTALRNLSQPEESVKADRLDRLTKALANVQMSDLERDLLNTLLDVGHGAQEQVASRHINPATGRRYTRARIGQVYSGLIARLRAYCCEELEGLPVAA